MVTDDSTVLYEMTGREHLVNETADMLGWRTINSITDLFFELDGKARLEAAAAWTSWLEQALMERGQLGVRETENAAWRAVDAARAKRDGPRRRSRPDDTDPEFDFT